MTTSSTETLRVFIAAYPDDAVRAELVRVQRELKKRLAAFDVRIKWTAPQTFHITLLFLGDIPANRVAPVFQGLEKTAGQFPTIGNRLSGVLYFKNPQVMVVGLSVSDELLRLQKELSEALGMEPGRFHAHFTLGRIKRGRPAAAFFQCLETAGVSPLPAEISALKLVQSELLPDGARHTVLGTVPLLNSKN